MHNKVASIIEKEWLTFSGLVGYLWFGFFVFLITSPSPSISGDSGGYVDFTHRNWHMVWLSIEGYTNRSASIIAPFTLFGNPVAIEIWQTILFALAVSTLIFFVYKIDKASSTTTCAATDLPPPVAPATIV